MRQFKIIFTLVVYCSRTLFLFCIFFMWAGRKTDTISFFISFCTWEPREVWTRTQRTPKMCHCATAVPEILCVRMCVSAIDSPRFLTVSLVYFLLSKNCALTIQTQHVSQQAVPIGSNYTLSKCLASILPTLPIYSEFLFSWFYIPCFLCLLLHKQDSYKHV